MEDEKLRRECRVVVRDLRSILPETMLSHLAVPSQKGDEEVEIISEATERSCMSSPTKTGSRQTEFMEPASTYLEQKIHRQEVFKTKSVNEVSDKDPKARTCVKKFKNLNIYKKRHSLMKSHKRRHSGNSNSLSTANQAKNHLLQKYGSTLLRKSSLLVSPDETSPAQFGSCETFDHSGSELDAVSESAQTILVQDQNNVSHCKNLNFKTLEQPTKTISDVIEKSPIERTQPSCPMPPVGLSVKVGVGHQLPTLQAKCVLTCLEKCQTSLTPQFAEFSSCVVKASAQLPVAKVLIPIDDERVLQFMRIKWQSSPALQRIALSKPQSPPGGMHDINTEHRILSDVDEMASKDLNENTDKHSTSVIKRNCQESLECDEKSVHGKKNNRKLVKRKRKSPIIYRSGIDLNTNPQDNTDLVSTSECIVSTPNKICQEDAENVQKLPRERSKPTLIAGNEEKLTRKIEKGGSNALKRKRLQYLDTSILNLTDSDEETRNVPLITVEKFPQIFYDPDDTRGVSSTEAVTEEPRETTRGMKSHVMHELRRLNVAVFDMPNHQEPIMCKTSDVCNLGCVCSSLSTKTGRDHCGLEECMFGCVCSKPHSKEQAYNDPSYTWMQDKAKANLAKEEQHFKQTVVRSVKDGLVLVEGRKKREIKLPNRYRQDFVADTDLRFCRQFGSMKTIKGVLEEAHLPDKDNNQLKQSKKSTGSKNTCLTIPEKGGSEVTDILNTSSESEIFDSQDSPFSARTGLYDFKSKDDRKDKQKQLLSESPCEKIEAASDLKIVSTQSVKVEEWEKSNNKLDGVSNLELSCTALFKPSSNTENKHVRLLSWKGLRDDIDKKNAFVWIKSVTSKPKIYLTCSHLKPTENCIDIQSIDQLSQEYKEFPFHVKSLRSDYSLSDTEGQCVWIVKSIKSHWMIVGYMQPGQKNRTLCENPEIDILSTVEENLCHRWWVMDIRQDFDLIYFMDFKKAITKHQISTLVKLSNEYSESETKMHRILLNRRRPKIDPRPTPYPDFGAYSLPNRPTEVLIGPYDYSKEPRFHVYAQKVLSDERTEYEKIPLFYCGGGEFVRVNAQGALSLHTETPPEKYVKGMWYESSGSEIRKCDAQSLIPTAASEQVENGGFPQTDLPSHLNGTECVVNESEDLPKKSSTSSSGITNYESYGSDIESVKTWSESSYEGNESPKERQDNLISPVADKENIIQPENFHKKHSIKHKKRSHESNLSNVPLEKCSQVGTFLEAETDHSVNSHIDDCRDLPELKVEYLIPSVGIGFLPVTYLPTDALSVPHFTQPGLLQFFHTREELIQEINRLIHFKLACLRQKCAVVLRRHDICRCVAWRGVWIKEKCAHLPQFSPEVFNGYFMLTKYGLLDIRTADDKSLRKLGEDWIDWLKDDELKIKFSTWKEQKSGDRQDYSNMPLPDAIGLAKKEVLKSSDAHDPTYYEDEAKKGMRDTLISSLSRKLNGIPGTVIPNFLEKLDLDILWNSQQSISSLGSAMFQSTKLSQSTLSANNSKNCQRSSRSHCRNTNKTLTFKSGFIVKEMNNTTEKSVDRNENEESRMQQQEQTQTKEHITSKLTPSPRKDILHNMNGLACRLSPFSRLNICVEEGGIKYVPLSSPPRPSSPLECMADIQTSPGKQPNILKRMKCGFPDSSPNKCVSSSGFYNIKHSRKQTFSVSADNEEEPVFLEDPEDNLDSRNQLDSEQSPSIKVEMSCPPCGSHLKTSVGEISMPRSSIESAAYEGSCSSPSAVTSFLQRRGSEPPLKISSVGSGASYWNEPSKVVSPSNPDASVGVDTLPVSSSESTSTLQISSVYSTKSSSSSPLSTQTELSSSVDPVSSLRISSVVSVPKLNSSSSHSAILIQHGLRRLRRPVSFTTARTMVKSNSALGTIESNHPRGASDSKGASPPNSTKTRTMVKSDSASGTIRNHHPTGASDTKGASHPPNSPKTRTMVQSSSALGNMRNNLETGVSDTKNLTKMKSFIEEEPNNRFQNVESATKTIKILKKGSGVVTVTVPVAALKVLPPAYINGKLQSSLLMKGGGSLPYRQEDDKTSDLSSNSLARDNASAD